MWRKKQPNGQLYILIGVGMVFFIILLALSIDLGTMYYTRQKQHNVTDAAALAGGHYLPDSETAKEKAFDYYRRNWIIQYVGEMEQDPAEFEVAPEESTLQQLESIPSENTTFYRLGEDEIAITTPLQVESDDPPENVIQVVGRHKSPVHFARFFGFGRAPITAMARAIIWPACAVGGPTDGIVPWVIAYNDVASFETHQSYTLVEGAVGSELGAFRPLRLGGSGAANYEDKLIHGFRQRVRCLEDLEVEPADIKSATQDGVQQRIDADQRVVVFPVTQTPDPGPTGTVKVHGFVAFYLNGPATVAEGRVEIPVIYVPDAVRGSDPENIAPRNSNVWGPALIRLSGQPGT